ncbi:MAG: FeoB-associated Cys-rich membrane protein [Bacteroidetes bacterium]|nr:FeoB-associated Cys-rich membrane protein [Bacteroidota bacterium]
MQLFITYLIVSSAVITAVFYIFTEMRKQFRQPSGCTDGCNGCAIASLKEKV